MMIIKERKGLDHHYVAAKVSIVKLIRAADEMGTESAAVTLRLLFRD